MEPAWNVFLVVALKSFSCIKHAKRELENRVLVFRIHGDRIFFLNRRQNASADGDGRQCLGLVWRPRHQEIA